MTNATLNLQMREIPVEDTAMLNRIFMLRVKCREASGYITFDKYPDGWHDDEDYQAKHYVVFSGEEPVASGRVNIYASVYDIPCFPTFPPLVNFKDGKTGFLYRNGVLPEYRSMGISKLLNNIREQYMIDNGCKYSMGYCRDFQVTNFLKHGYKNYGALDTTKVKWELQPDNWNLMIKEL